MTTIPEDMKLTTMIQIWLDEAGWKDDIDIGIDPEARTARAITLYELDGNFYRVIIEADEGRQQLGVYIYGCIGIPAARYAEACKLVNGINCRIGTGRIAAISDGPFQYRALVDLDGKSTDTIAIDKPFGGGRRAFKDWSNGMGQLIFGEKSADQILEELDKAHQPPGTGADTLICPGSLVPS